MATFLRRFPFFHLILCCLKSYSHHGGFPWPFTDNKIDEKPQQMKAMKNVNSFPFTMQPQLTQKIERKPSYLYIEQTKKGKKNCKEIKNMPNEMVRISTGVHLNCIHNEFEHIHTLAPIKTL